MKHFKNGILAVLLLFSLSSLIAFKGLDSISGNTNADKQDCSIQLFDGDNFEGNSVTLDGPDDFSDLTNMPDPNNADWSGAVRSVMVGENTTLTVWPEEDFQGESQEYTTGSYPSVNNIQSIKIKCNI